jgi:ribonuclease T2
MIRILSSLVLACLLAGCVRTTPASSGSSPSQSQGAQGVRAAPAKVAEEFSLRPVASGATPTVEAAPSGPNGGPGIAATFGLYVLALTWSPNFCCSHSSKEECQGLDGTFGATHLTIHGLWPNYTDAQAQQAGANWPQYCAPYSSCNTKSPAAGCDPDPSTIPADMKTYGPGYVSDDNFLADHEWPKHGSCTGLDSGTYFSAAISALKRLPGDQGTPDLLTQNIGGTVSATDLRAAFGSPESVMLSCDSSCNLTQVSICLTNGASGQPTTRTACPSNTTTSAYDNGCFVNNCQNVTIQATGQCSSGGSSSGGSSSGGSGGKCGNPGQGPACTDDSACADQGYLRCAKSGCCTTVPL